MKLKNFAVKIYGWFKENEYVSGGSPEHDEIMIVKAINAEKAVPLACAMFDAEHDFDVVCGEIM